MNPIKLSKSERAALSQRARSRAGRADDARRARLILLLEAGNTHAQIRRKLSCSSAFIYRWSKRFETQRLAGLFSRHPGQDSRKPRRLEGRTACGAPDFVKKTVDVIGLYLHPTQHAAVFCVAEKTATQLHRLGSVLMPAATERLGLEYSRRGMLSLYAALNTPTAEVLGHHPAAPHTSADFLGFLAEIAAHQLDGTELHVLTDDLSAHKTVQIKDLPAMHCNIHLHFTRTYSSWLRQVALCFSEIERAANVRDAIPLAPDLTRTLVRHIRRYSEFATMSWKFIDPHRVTVKPPRTVH